MGFFYFDETIQEKAGFIIGAYVFSQHDLTPSIFSAIESVGLTPKVDEFKSGARMTAHPEQLQLRKILGSMLLGTQIGAVVLPVALRADLGSEALKGLSKILLSNNLKQNRHAVYFDSGIAIKDADKIAFNNKSDNCCELYTEQDSTHIGGIQLADLVAHYLGMMLLEQLGLISKKVRVGENSGYDPDLEVELGFELWASLRYSFFKAPQPIGVTDDDPVGTMTFDVENYGLHIASSCNHVLSGAATQRFGDCYLGCIH